MSVHDLRVFFSYKAYKCTHNRKVKLFRLCTDLFPETAKVFLSNMVHILRLFCPKMSASPSYLPEVETITDRKTTPQNRRTPDIFIVPKE